jgi:hypothetical protein
MSIYAVIVIAVVVALGAAYWLKLRPSWWLLRDRVPDERSWQALFPPEQMPAVRLALQAVVDAFLLRREDIYRLRPDDRLHAIYRAAYPSNQAPDALEFETLSKWLVTHCHVPESVLAQESDPSVQDVVRWYLRYSGA